MSRAPEEAFGGEAGHDSDFRIGDRVIQPRLNRVSTPAETIQLEPKIMPVLRCLAESPGEVVSKERLFAEVWQGTYVSEDVLTRAIAELRRVFEDSASAPRVIETIRKSGYRLLVSPEPIRDDSTPAEPLPEVRLPRAVVTRAAFAAVALAVALVTVAFFLWSRR